MSDCQICGQPMPAGEEMFLYHGLSGPCPAADGIRALPRSEEPATKEEACDHKLVKICCGPHTEELVATLKSKLQDSVKVEQLLREARLDTLREVYNDLATRPVDGWHATFHWLQQELGLAPTKQDGTLGSIRRKP